MAYFVVTYDLVKDKDYKKLISELEELNAAKIALSVWLIELNNTCAEVRDHLAGYVDSDDKLVVIEFDKKPRFTRGFTSGSKWITERFG